jgi:hypothetical protein
LEGNTWEDSGNVANAPEKVAKFHATHPAAPRRIRAMAFGSIPFRPIPVATSASGRCLSEGGVIVRGTLFRSASPFHRPPTAPTSPRYVPPHRRVGPDTGPGSAADPTPVVRWRAYTHQIASGPHGHCSHCCSYHYVLRPLYLHYVY